MRQKSLTSPLGAQAEKMHSDVRRTAPKRYAAEADGFRRAQWARLCGQSALRMLRLESAQSSRGRRHRVD